MNDNLSRDLAPILSRKSIRKYTERPVTDEVAEALLRAAMAAPNTINNKDWAFVAVREQETLEALVQNQNGNANMLRSAQLAIIVCGDLKLAHGQYPEFWIQDCSAAAQNILTAANILGLGAVWLGVYPVPRFVEGVRRILGLPEHIVPLCIISVGYPDEDPPTRHVFSPEKIHWEHWREQS